MRSLLPRPPSLYVRSHRRINIPPPPPFPPPRPHGLLWPSCSPTHISIPSQRTMAVFALGDGAMLQRGRSTAERVLLDTELLYPLVLILAFVISAAVYSVATSRSEEQLDAPTITGPGGRPLPITKRKKKREAARSDERRISKAAKLTLRCLMASLVLTFVANAAVIFAHALTDRRISVPGHLAWWCGDERIVSFRVVLFLVCPGSQPLTQEQVYIAGSIFLYLYVLITLFDRQDTPNVAHILTWSLGLLGEIAILVSSASGKSDLTRLRIQEAADWDLAEHILAILRLAMLSGALLVCSPIAARARVRDRQARAEEACPAEMDEITPLLTRDPMAEANYHSRDSNRRPRANTATSHASQYNGADEFAPTTKEEDAAFYRPEKLQHKNWYEYCRGYKLFFQYLWPSKSRGLKGVIFVCFLLVMGQRVINVLVPYQLGIVADILRDQAGLGVMPWGELLLLLGYKLLQGSSGILGCLRDILWIPVSQHTYRALTTAAFEHVHSLSLEFHLSKKTGEVLSALNKGASVNSFLEQVTFQVGPMLLDLLLAIFFFYNRFGPIYALIVSVVSFYYLYLTVRMAATRADQRRDMVNADREEEAVKNDSVTSYETVKYFNAESFEFGRYQTAIRKFQAAEAKVTWGITIMNMAQSLVFLMGILTAAMVCGFEVSAGTRTVGDWVALMTYLAQLQGPLTFLGVFYRTVQQAMISGERLLELFKIRPTVVDKAGVQPLHHCDGNIKWDAVKFSYDKRRPALQNVSFECKPGTTTAFVGESGGGKSTIFRLMFRYYNCNSGRIEIDGNDVKDVTIDSVRRFIGVVPQETILFNESLMFNLRYANPSATDDEIFEACRLAAIHDRILSFPDGYETNVGDRGVRLSGGEKQRVAIARTILKNPKIIMLDEATSALDGETEQRIQAKLISGNLGQGRTLLIIA